MVLQRDQTKVANGTVKLDQQVDVALLGSLVRAKRAEQARLRTP